MMGSTHRALGFVAGAAFGSATVTAAGRLSPDADQYRGWRLADRVTPDELLGRGRPMQHRGITHWWAWPAAASAVLVLGDVPERGGWVWLLLCSLVAGWWSHLLGDLVFGRADGFSGRGPGVPVLPWWAHLGVGLRCGGLLERVTGVALVPLGVWVVAASAGVVAGPTVVAGWSA
nr:metal-dependent hydrolase [Kineosporia sp. R_H_3]